MKDLIKRLYEGKIRLMFYFGLGYSEFSGLISMVKDLAIILAFMAVVFQIHLGLIVYICIGVVAFISFALLGIILKVTGMSDFATRTSNSVNPELKLINEIAKKLNI